ncbi:hypothetical protein ABZ543_12955 [Streptomyces roseifaciens]
MNTTITLPDFDSFGSQAISALDNPELAVAETQRLLKADRDSNRPVIEAPGETHVRLERGIYRDGAWHHDAEVRELTGEDEEAIAAAGSPLRVIDTLLLRGVVRVGPESMSRQVAGELLIGDRELLILGIRRATFGDTIEFEALPCPHCEELTDLSVPLDAIPLVRLAEPERTELEVPLRRGAVAHVALPTGSDQAAVLSLRDATEAKQNSEVLSRCLLRVVSADGVVEEKPNARKLSIADRHTLLDFLTKTQPGPRYHDFSYTHEACGEEVPLPITLAILFRGV